MTPTRKLVRDDPDEARRRILAAFRETGTYAAAAEHLECSLRSLHRFVTELDMRDAVDGLLSPHALESRPNVDDDMARVAAVVDMRAAGIPWMQVAAKLGVTHQTIHRWAKKRGLT